MPGSTSEQTRFVTQVMKHLMTAKARALGPYLIERNSGPHLLCFNLAARNLLLQLQYFLT